MAKKFYIVPADYLESNEPDLFENGDAEACKQLGAIVINTNLSKLKLRAVIESAIKEAEKK